MLAINPATPADVIKYLLPDIDGILVMTVNPGFAGQSLAPATLDKSRDIRKMQDKSGSPGAVIEVDGNVSFENARLMRQAGASVFVGGSSSAFSMGDTLSANIQKNECYLWEVRKQYG